MHSLYIVLFALGIYNSVCLIQSGQSSSATPCEIALPFTNRHISAFYEQKVIGTGCSTNNTTSKNQEVHIISLKKIGPVFRNDVAEVHLFIKSRSDEVLWEPLIIVLNSLEPVKWRVRTEILAPARKKHFFLIPSYSSVRLVKSNSKRVVRKFDHLPQKKEKLLEWVMKDYGAVTSFTELQRGNQVTLHVGRAKSSSGHICELKDGQAEAVEASYEQPQLLAGCVVQPRTNILSRVAYVIELDNVESNPDRKKVIEVELEIKGGSRRTTHRDFWLVLKSPAKVHWKIKTKKLQGYAEIVSNSHIDMTGIKMDPVSDRMEEFTESGQEFLKWVEIYVGPVAMYTGITLANKIKLVIPDNDGHQKPAVQKFLIPPFENVPLTKNVFKQHIQTECIGQGAIKVALSKLVYQTFDLDLNQLSFLSPLCTATQNSTHVLWEAAVGECNTKKVVIDGQSSLHNAILIHRSDALEETGSGNHYYGEEDELNNSGSGSETYIDDEDYERLNTIKNDVSCVLHKPEDNNVLHKLEDHNINKTVLDVVPENKLHSNNDISYHVQLYKTPYYMDANYRYPMNVSIKSNVYVDAFIQGDVSLRVQIVSCQLSKEMDRDSSSVKTLIHNGCKAADVSWEPVPLGKPLMGSVTQSQRFKFSLVSMIPYINQYLFLRCRLTVCKNYNTSDNTAISQCIDNKEQMCSEGVPNIASSRLFTEVVGPMRIVDSNPFVFTKKPDNSVNINVDSNTNKQEGKIDHQSLVVDGLESGTVIGIAFAAFFIGVLLMAALWFIHTHTGPLKHAVASGRAGLDGSGESTPMSTAPIAINT